MDKRQAIEFLGYLLRDKNIERTIYEDALKIAIESLKAQLSKEDTTKDAISRQATIDAVNNAFDRETLLTGFVRSIAVRAIRDMPSVQPEPAISLSWIEKYIEWLKSFDNEFANLEVAHISVMVKKWRSEQNETD